MTPNEPNGIVITWHQRGSAPATIRITDGEGNEVRVIQQDAGAGLRSVVWNLGGGRNQPAVAPGDYTVTLPVGNVTETRVARVKQPVVVPRPL